MIPFDFEYYKPTGVSQAVDLFMSLDEQGKEPLYYGGGTEIISMARANSIYTGGVIDIKGIPECKEFGFQDKELIIGSGVTLTTISESNTFPMLGITVARIADHTIQGKITLGGNVASTVIYRESVLPLLIVDSKIAIAGPGGIRKVPLNQVFKDRLRLEKGEFIMQFIIDSQYLNLPFFHRKTTKIDKIDYPLVTVVALKKDKKVLAGFSGLCNYPFRSPEMEEYLNQGDIPPETKIEKVLGCIPAPIQENIHGSAKYRRFVLQNILTDVLKM